MRSRLKAKHSSSSQQNVWGLIFLGLYFLPALLLGISGIRTNGEARQVLLIGAGFQMFICVLGFASRGFHRQPISSAFILLYGLGLAWLFIANNPKDWLYYLSQSLLLVIPLVAVALQTLTDLGAPALRRARLLARRLEQRRDWPADLERCRRMPEVKALRESLHLDASPALEMLHHARPQVQMAALGALEYRRRWFPGQADLVLHVALRAKHSEVRAAALIALANASDRAVIEAISEHLRDPSPEVRQAAAEALFWDTETRWPWIRHAIHRSLADPHCQEDGPIRCESGMLPPLALDDLRGWAAEVGFTGHRASQSLAAHYRQLIHESEDSSIVAEIRAQVFDPQSPGPLRVELTRLLLEHRSLDEDMLMDLINAGCPASLRLLASEGLLEQGDSPQARATLRELARTPNREMALATAEVAQRCLAIDFGLPMNGPRPALHSRLAAEVSRRVMAWAGEDQRTEERDRRDSQRVPSQA